MRGDEHHRTAISARLRARVAIVGSPHPGRLNPRCRGSAAAAALHPMLASPLGYSLPFSRVRASTGWRTVGLALALSAIAVAQSTPPAPRSIPPAEEDPIVLTPFTVNTSLDRGYQAENTLSGSRLNSSLNDTPASVSVFTKEFLQDVGLTELRELVEYSVSATLNFNDTGAETNANPYVNATALTRKIDIRGINSSQGLDYFQSITPDDSYRIGRYAESRGPNGILFGISD